MLQLYFKSHLCPLKLYACMYFQVTVGYSKPVQYNLTPGKTLGRGRRQAFAKHAYRDRAVKRHIIRLVSQECKVEIKKLCKKDSPIVRSKREDLMTFTWKSFLEAVQENAPTLFPLLQSCIPTATSLNHKAITGMCVAILTKARCSSACLVQKIVSLVLYAGHCSKQVDVIYTYTADTFQ